MLRDPRWHQLNQSQLRRLTLLTLAMLAVFGFLGLRLWYLQVIHHERLVERAAENRQRRVAVAPPRGTIYDEKGRLLVGNRPAFGVAVLRQEVAEKEPLLKRLAAQLPSMSLADLKQRWQRGLRQPPYQPMVLARDVSWAVVESLLENRLHLPGILIQPQPIRSYPYDDLAAHTVGYVSRITAQQLRQSRFEGYLSNARVGKTGLEKKFEQQLHGKQGWRLLEVDAEGRLVRQVDQQTPLPGNSLTLTLNRNLQLVAERAFGAKAGAAVVLNPRNGAIWALVSRPAYNPAAFAAGIGQQQWQQLLQNSRKPLQHKALQATYPPGSTFKPVVALAALKEGTVTPRTRLYCNGEFTLGDSLFRCWKERGHGGVRLHRAIRESCDVYFYKVGLDLGITPMARMATAFGIGCKQGFVLPEEAGLMPTPSWKRRQTGNSWYQGETVIAAIGQGYVHATPLQLAMMTGAIANGGKLWQPRLIKAIKTPQGEVLQQPQPQLQRHIKLDAAHLQAIRAAMEAVVEEPHGTGWRVRLDDVRVAGKTGTSQVVAVSRDEDRHEQQEKEVPYAERDHALFIAYAPADDPQIALAVVVEHGVHGGSAAGPIAKRILRAYFDLMSE